MKPYIFRFIIAVIAFIAGISLVGFYLGNSLLTESSPITFNEVSEQHVDKISLEQPQELTFEKISAGSAINTVTKERISFMDFRASDGTNIQVNHFYVGDSYQKEL